MGASELGYAYKKARAKLKREAPPYCALCGEWIDRELHYRDPMAWEADHKVPCAVAPDLATEYDYNLQPAHRVCNQRKGKDSTKSTVHKGSRRW